MGKKKKKTSKDNELYNIKVRQLVSEKICGLINTSFTISQLFYNTDTAPRT